MTETGNRKTEVISWDWKEQIDLDKLGNAIRTLSGGTLDLREANTDGDFYAVVISSQPIAPEQAQALFEAEYYADMED
jgi:hypothetical protein